MNVIRQVSVVLSVSSTYFDPSSVAPIRSLVRCDYYVLAVDSFSHSKRSVEAVIKLVAPLLLFQEYFLSLP